MILLFIFDWLFGWFDLAFQFFFSHWNTEKYSGYNNHVKTNSSISTYCLLLYSFPNQCSQSVCKLMQKIDVEKCISHLFEVRSKNKVCWCQFELYIHISNLTHITHVFFLIHLNLRSLTKKEINDIWIMEIE